MKNQSFHRPKIRIQEIPTLGFDQLKAKTINALDKLGKQKFSAEPGGYSLENWIRGVSLLLDDFEEKAGAARLSKDYQATRRELDSRLSKPPLVAPIDAEMAELTAGISSIEGRIESERTRIVSRISELKATKEKLSAELAAEQEHAADASLAQEDDSLFRRLLRGKKTAATSNEGKIRELESKLAALPDEMRDQRTLLKLMDLHTPESRFAEEWRRLESMQSKLKELEAEKRDRTQYVREREEVMGSMAEAISRLT